MNSTTMGYAMGGKHEGDKPKDKPVEPITPSKNGDRPDKGGTHEKGK